MNQIYMNSTTIEMGESGILRVVRATDREFSAFETHTAPGHSAVMN
jgi:hypothetical protein